MADDSSIVVTETSDGDGSEGFTATKTDANGTVVWEWQVKLNVSYRKHSNTYLKPGCALQNYGNFIPIVKSHVAASTST